MRRHLRSAKAERRLEKRLEAAACIHLLRIERIPQRERLGSALARREQIINLFPHLGVAERRIEILHDLEVRRAGIAGREVLGHRLRIVDEGRIEPEAAERVVIVVRHSPIPRRRRTSSWARRRQVTRSWRTLPGDVSICSAIRSFDSSRR